eukprot:52408-Alexandrium_andersonii.AAC.1
MRQLSLAAAPPAPLHGKSDDAALDGSGAEAAALRPPEDPAKGEAGVEGTEGAGAPPAEEGKAGGPPA